MTFTFYTSTHLEVYEDTLLTMEERLLTCIQGYMIEILAKILPKATAGLQRFCQSLKAYVGTAAQVES
jgi:hypothetical protein